MGGIIGEMNEKEVSKGRCKKKKENGELLSEKGKKFIVIGERFLEMWKIEDRGGERRNRGGINVEGEEDEVNGVDDVERRINKEDEKEGKEVNIRESESNKKVLIGWKELKKGLIIVEEKILGIGGVEKKKKMMRKERMEEEKLIKRKISEGRVGRIGDEEDFCERSKKWEDGVKIDELVILIKSEGGGEGWESMDIVKGKEVIGDDGLVKGGKIGMEEKEKKLVG